MCYCEVISRERIMTNISRIVFLFFMISVGCLVVSTSLNAEILFQDDFDGYTDSPENHGWHMSSAISIPSNEGYNGSRCAKVAYTRSGTSPYWMGWNGIGGYNVDRIYVRFYYKVDANQGGCKFIKLFGKSDDDGYANSTIPLEQSDGRPKYVRYGRGNSIVNDCQDFVRFTGKTTDPNVTVLTCSEGITPDGEWHCFEFYMKYNTDGNRDGEYMVWYDGTLRLHATNVVNRNNANLGEFRSIDFANYTATSTDYGRPLWYDNIVIADEYIGPIGESREDFTPPTTNGHRPSRGQANVSADSDIIVHTQDTGDDVDQSSIVMTVNGERVNPAISGSSADYTVSYNPPVDFTPGDVVTVTVDAQDQHNPANIMPQDRYSFTIADAGGEDKQPGEGDTKVFGDVSGSDYRGTCQDTFVNAGVRSSNYSNDSQTLNTYTWPTNTSANRVVMKWDLSAIPQNATIHEATLSLDMYSAHGDESYEVSAHRIVTNNPNISSCTWNTYDGTHSWTGGTNGGEQDLAPAESTAIVDRTAGYKNCSITQMVQQWVSNPSSNYGLMLDSDSTAASDSNRLFRPTEYSNPDQRPKLTVTYSDSSKISPPENLRLVH